MKRYKCYFELCMTWHGPQPKEISFTKWKKQTFLNWVFFKISSSYTTSLILLTLTKYVNHEIWKRREINYSHLWNILITTLWHYPYRKWLICLNIAPISVLTTFTRHGESSLHIIIQIRWIQTHSMYSLNVFLVHLFISLYVWWSKIFKTFHCSSICNM